MAGKKSPQSKAPSAVELMLIMQHVMDDKDSAPPDRVVDALAKGMLALQDDEFISVWLAAGTLKGLSVQGIPKVEKPPRHPAAWDRLDRQIGKRVMSALKPRPDDKPKKTGGVKKPTKV